MKSLANWRPLMIIVTIAFLFGLLVFSGEFPAEDPKIRAARQEMLLAIENYLASQDEFKLDKTAAPDEYYLNSRDSIYLVYEIIKNGKIRSLQAVSKVMEEDSEKEKFSINQVLHSGKYSSRSIALHLPCLKQTIHYYYKPEECLNYYDKDIYLAIAPKDKGKLLQLISDLDRHSFGYRQDLLEAIEQFMSVPQPLTGDKKEDWIYVFNTYDSIMTMYHAIKNSQPVDRRVFNGLSMSCKPLKSVAIRIPCQEEAFAWYAWVFRNRENYVILHSYRQSTDFLLTGEDQEKIRAIMQGIDKKQSTVSQSPGKNSLTEQDQETKEGQKAKEAVSQVNNNTKENEFLEIKTEKFTLKLKGPGQIIDNKIVKNISGSALQIAEPVDTEKVEECLVEVIPSEKIRIDPQTGEEIKIQY
ncbi:hypothetical protein EII17_04485 [Clostridiales bacterium COT073_COT-073]|nr:hypothetical protein EII17_04485 [Clostridiales bacterium COT073_COT-073]